MLSLYPRVLHQGTSPVLGSSRSSLPGIFLFINVAMCTCTCACVRVERKRGKKRRETWGWRDEAQTRKVLKPCNCDQSDV